LSGGTAQSVDGIEHAELDFVGIPRSDSVQLRERLAIRAQTRAVVGRRASRQNNRKCRKNW
jgi:hypothetical protein